MAAKYWIKLYHEILHDRKMVTLDNQLWRRVIECFLLAGELDDGGYLPSLVDIAFTLRVDVEQLETDLNELIRIGILEYTNGRYFVAKFRDRQKPMPKAEYMRRKRDTEQREEYYQDRYQSVTNSNAEKIREEESRGEETDTAPAFRQLFDAFLDASGLDETLLHPKRCVDEIVEKWIPANITVEEVRQTITDYQNKPLTISGPWSITNGFAVTRSKMKASQEANSGYHYAGS